MRTDAITDGRQVTCPNASTIGYGKTRAQVGDWVTWRDTSGQTHTGRMIARVHYAPPCGETPMTRNWIEVLTLGMEFTHGFVRWIDPADVLEVHANTPDIARLLAWFAGPLPSRSWISGEGRTEGAADYGTISANQQADTPDWDFARKIDRFNEYRRRNGLSEER